MDTRANLALRKKEKGYNCCQAIVCTYADVLKIDEALLFKLTEGFGDGICETGQTCGAILGILMIASYINSTGNLEKPNSKKSTYHFGYDLLTQFKEQNNSTQCKELRQSGRSCEGFLMDCCFILEQNLLKNKI